MRECEIQAIFCQSFGLRKDGPGISNEALAAAITRIREDFPCPPQLIIQKDTADAFSQEVKIDKIISGHQTAGKYLGSYEVSRQCAEYCREKRIKNLLVFAHPHHIWRVKRVTEKFGLNCLAVSIPVPYDQRSSQIWTRSKWLFIPREIIVIIAYWLTKKI